MRTRSRKSNSHSEVYPMKQILNSKRSGSHLRFNHNKQLLKCKRSNSRFDFCHNSNLVKSKRSQGVFGMSFGMIFSILLIVFFLAAAFIAIRFFLGLKKQAEIGLFYDELQAELDRAWNAGEASFEFEGRLPSGIDYTCFINMSAPASSDADLASRQVYNDARFGSYEPNFVLYPTEKAGSLSHKKLAHFKMPETNPYCIAVSDGIAKMKIEKSFDEALPRVS